MRSLSYILKLFIPPILLAKYRSVSHKDSNPYKGNYKTWADAKLNSKGYDTPEILENCKNAILKVKNNEAVFERDSVLISKPQYPWPLIACLQHIALGNYGSIDIIDFGGSLGSTYFQIRPFISYFKNLSWTVVEQVNFVQCGIKYFQNHHLNFKYSIKDAMQFKNPNCILLSGVLQCLQEPYQLINEVINTETEYILIDRTSFITEKQRLTVLKIDDDAYKVSYPLWFFNEDDFLNLFFEKYDLVIDFESTADGAFFTKEKNKMYWKGYLFKIKKRG